MKATPPHAFTLVEVVLALGVVSFAVLTMLTLMPTGLGVYQHAQTNNVETQIVQEVNNELQNSSYSNLFVNGNPTTNITSYNHTFDVDGQDITENASGATPIYNVTLLATNFTVGGVSVLTNSAGLPVAQTIEIKLAYHNSTNTFSTMVLSKGY